MLARSRPFGIRCALDISLHMLQSVAVSEYGSTTASSQQHEGYFTVASLASALEHTYRPLLESPPPSLGGRQPSTHRRRLAPHAPPGGAPKKCCGPPMCGGGPGGGARLGLWPGDMWGGAEAGCMYTGGPPPIAPPPQPNRPPLPANCAGGGRPLPAPIMGPPPPGPGGGGPS